MLVDVLLVDPVDNEDDNHEEHHQIGQLEDVEGVEGPDVQQHHQLELDGEGRPPHFLVQLHLAQLAPLAPRGHDLLAARVEQPVPQVDKGHDHSHAQECYDCHKQLLQFHVDGDAPN